MSDGKTAKELADQLRMTVDLANAIIQELAAHHNVKVRMSFQACEYINHPYSTIIIEEVTQKL